ncbi:Uncharacterised protein [Eubacterium limosum]|uniref:Uncharacterized protein n=1 Tax=Eubacterium limosum TaxID=1736 RepID=A0A6N3FQT9_EUBLI
MENIANIIDQLVQVKRMISRLNEKKTLLEAEILAQAEQDLKNTKYKTVHYDGTMGDRVTATKAASVKVIYPSYLVSIFGDAYKDVVKEETNYKLSEPAKRMMAGLYLNEYSELSIEDVLRDIEAPPEKKELLKKKIKGQRFATDKKNLMDIAGLDEKNAEIFAYFAAEAAVWNDFLKLMAVNGKNDPASIDRALELIDSAVMVDESTKIAVEVRDA